MIEFERRVDKFQRASEAILSFLNRHRNGELQLDVEVYCFSLKHTKMIFVSPLCRTVLGHRILPPTMRIVVVLGGG